MIKNIPNQDNLSSEEDIYQLIYMNDKNQSVEVYETNYLPCDDLFSHLKTGESIFITKKKIANHTSNPCFTKRTNQAIKKKKSMYLTRS